MGRREDSWFIRYELLKKYYQYYGTANVLQSFKTNNGIDYDEDGIPLGVWLSAQKQFYKRGVLEESRITLLKKIGVVFDTSIHDLKWMKKYDLALKYYKKYGNLNFGNAFKTKDGITYDCKGDNLSNWIHTQQILYSLGKLDDKRYSFLRKIGIDFERSKFELNWEERYKLAKKYYEHYGDLMVPRSFKTKDGIKRNKNGIALGVWISSQKDAYKKGVLNEERKLLLERIGLNDIMSMNDKKWLDNYALVKVYYEKYGSLEMSQKFKTKNGIDYDEDGIVLNFWLYKQRKEYKLGKLDDEKIRLLMEINFDFDNYKRKNMWEVKYSLVKAYYSHYGNVNIPCGFRTVNGYDRVDKNSDGVDIGSWLRSQRILYRQGKLSQDRFYKLVDVGVVWDVKTKSKQIACLCDVLNIDKELNRIVLRRLTYQECLAKIMFLRHLNIPYENEGILHEIFSMSSFNIKEKYGLTLEELVNKYVFHMDRKKLVKEVCDNG